MTRIEEIAGKLTTAQRDAMRKAEPVSSGISIWAPHRGTLNGLAKRGLCGEQSWRSEAFLTPLGLAVRDHLMKEQGE